MSWKSRMNHHFAHTGSGNASSSRLPGNATDLLTAWKPFTWTEAVATDNSTTRAGARYPYTVTTQQLKINPIPASRGDLITEKWPRQIVARSSFSDVIIDLKIGGVKLTGTSLPQLGELTPERQSELTLSPRRDTSGVTENKYWRTEQRFEFSLTRGVPLSASYSARPYGTTATRAILHKKLRWAGEAVKYGDKMWQLLSSSSIFVPYWGKF